MAYYFETKAQDGYIFQLPQYIHYLKTTVDGRVYHTELYIAKLSGLSCLREKTIFRHFEGLIETSHFLDQTEILFKSSLIFSAETSTSSTISKRRVSSI
jgi:hypothetical protein